MKSLILPASLTRTLAMLALALMGATLSFTPTTARAAVAQGEFIIDNPATDDIYNYLGTYGGISYYLEDLTFRYVGGIVGTAHDWNLIAVNEADGAFQSWAQETCTGCSIGGQTGNFTAVYTLTGTDFNFQFDNFGYQGYLTFTSGSGGLAGLRGGGPFSYDAVTGLTTYSYNYRLGH